jgi:hypothetical protein
MGRYSQVTRRIFGRLVIRGQSVSVRRKFEDQNATSPSCSRCSSRQIECFHSQSSCDLFPRFLRHDAVRRSLQHPYDGPYRVISRNEKTFTIQIKNSAKVVSVDRVKPAFLLKDYVITQGGAMQ